MDTNPVLDSLLAAAALASTILILGAAFLLILRTPKYQYSLRFLVLSIGCIAAVIGLWTALMRSSNGPRLTGPGIELDTSSPPEDRITPVQRFIDRLSEPFDGTQSDAVGADPRTKTDEPSRSDP